MIKQATEEVLQKRRLLPLVTIQKPEQIQPIAQCLISANLPIVEIAYRSKLASEAIREMAQIEGLIVGAGTVTTREQAVEAIACGARFIVTPGWSVEVVKTAQEYNIPIYPGVVTPSEVIEAKAWGIHTMKFFPAGNYGGIATLKALHGPFADCAFLPTGGIDVTNYQDYLKLDYVVAVGGSFITPAKFINEEDWEGLRAYIAAL